MKENLKQCFICGWQGKVQAVISHVLFNHRVIEIYNNDNSLYNNMTGLLHCPNTNCTHKNSIYLPTMRYQLNIHTLLNCGNLETRQNFLKNITLVQCNEDKLSEIEIKTNSTQNPAYKNRTKTKEKDGAQVIGVRTPPSTESDTISNYSSCTSLPGLIASSCSESTHSGKSNIQRLQNHIRTNKNSKGRISHRQMEAPRFT